MVSGRGRGRIQESCNPFATSAINCCIRCLGKGQLLIATYLQLRLEKVGGPMRVRAAAVVVLWTFARGFFTPNHGFLRFRIEDLGASCNALFQPDRDGLAANCPRP